MDEALKGRLHEMSKGDSRRENNIDNIQREISKLKKENEELNGGKSDNERHSQGTTYENGMAGKRDKEKKCSLAECRGEEQLMVKVKDVLNRMNLTVPKETDITKVKTYMKVNKLQIINLSRDKCSVNAVRSR